MNNFPTIRKDIFFRLAGDLPIMRYIDYRKRPQKAFVLNIF